MSDITPFAFVSNLETLFLKIAASQPLFSEGVLRSQRLLDFIERRAVLRFICTQAGKDTEVGLCSVEAVSSKEKGLIVFQGCISAPMAGHTHDLFILLKHTHDLERETKRVVNTLLRFWGKEAIALIEEAGASVKTPALMVAAPEASVAAEETEAAVTVVEDSVAEMPPEEGASEGQVLPETVEAAASAPQQVAEGSQIETIQPAEGAGVSEVQAGVEVAEATSKEGTPLANEMLSQEEQPTPEAQMAEVPPQS